MGGGGQPYDAMGGSGGASATMNGVPVTTQQPFDWSGFLGGMGSGMQAFSKGMNGAPQGSPQSPSSPQMTGVIETGAPYQFAPIPQVNIDDAIARLLGGL